MVLFFDLLGALLVSNVLQENDGSRSLSPIPNSFKYYSNRKGSQVVEVDWNNRCHVFDNGHAEWFRNTRAGQITLLNYIQFHILLQKCDLDSGLKSGLGRSEPGVEMDNGSNFTSEHHVNKNMIMSMWNNTRLPSALAPPGDFNNHQALFNESDVEIFMDYANTTNTSSSGTPLIFPGTKWCGRGDIARSPEDLGIYAGTDACCRDHDHCPKNIVARSSNYGLENTGDYTRSHCDCDQTFLKCLEKDRSLSALTSFKIASIYFNILQPKCFDYRHPSIGCRERRLSGDCINHLYDFQQPASYQFFSAQPYILREAKQLYNTILYGNSNFSPSIPTSIPLPNSAMVSDVINNLPKPPLISDNLLARTG